jgi:two-component system nitrogen regulation sensor histidine kinase NtrY
MGDLPSMVEQVARTGKARQEEMRIGGEGEGRPIRAAAAPLSGGGDLVVLEDLTLLAQAEKRAAWQEVARRMAHEVKNPLTPIKLTAQRLARRGAEGRLDLDSVIAGAETILGEVESLAKLVDSFSRFAKLPAPQPRPCDACELLRQVHALYASGHEGAEPAPDLRLDLPSGPMPANWDGDMVKRALINFIDNAIHATKGAEAGQGCLKIAISAQALADGVARLSVADEGPGVPPDVRPRLFEPYFSTKRQGTGLGLAIARKIAEDHGGHAGYEPLEKGSLFYLEMPL